MRANQRAVTCLVLLVGLCHTPKGFAIKARTVGVSTMTRHSFAVQASRYMSVVFLGQLHSSMLIPSRVRQLRLAQQHTKHGSVWLAPVWKPQVLATSDQSPCRWHTTAVEEGCSSAFCSLFCHPLATARRRDAGRATCLQPVIEVTTPTTQSLHVTCTTLCTHTDNSPTSSALQRSAWRRSPCSRYGLQSSRVVWYTARHRCTVPREAPCPQPSCEPLRARGSLVPTRLHAQRPPVETVVQSRPTTLCARPRAVGGRSCTHGTATFHLVEAWCVLQLYRPTKPCDTLTRLQLERANHRTSVFAPIPS